MACDRRRTRSAPTPWNDIRDDAPVEFSPLPPDLVGLDVFNLPCRTNWWAVTGRTSSCALTGHSMSSLLRCQAGVAAPRPLTDCREKIVSSAYCPEVADSLQVEFMRYGPAQDDKVTNSLQVDFMRYGPAQDDKAQSGGNPRWLMG
ncbi:hypothetical protein ElyMa_002506000 [Elysia marginata]|uniref:Uncharacterized protein n=1 Tax=Elysia marginata TaxID=1093978 RepID=A0AAV4GQ74_9GAST|nr:hypothetical protein ElyMa_002506000 [Elysia marginata]